mmetsp:Transcript_10406/g.31807  ORF Transcript_10406/g.31807 Transcript_10406/m.31807 type:complete len:262 (-) Transcript_10406:215-1000(-)
MTSSFAFSRAMASSLLRSWLLCSELLTAVPVGRCTIRTAVSTLFTFWPPLPPLRMVVISTSFSSTSTPCSSSSSSFGMTSMPAKLVWRFPCALNGDIRTSRCVPFSALRYPYANSPSTSSVADLYPHSSPGLSSARRTENPRLSQKRVTIRTRISAQSCASVPPAPARTVTTAPLRSYGPDSVLRRPYAASSLSSSSTLSTASSTTSAAPSSPPSSLSSSSALSASATCSPHLSASASSLRCSSSSFMTTRAVLPSSQKPS